MEDLLEENLEGFLLHFICRKPLINNYSENVSHAVAMLTIKNGCACGVWCIYFHPLPDG